MSGSMHYLLMTSAQASVIIIGLLASWRWLARRVSASWLYLFWVVAMVRLVVPGMLPGGIRIGNFLPWQTSTMVSAEPVSLTCGPRLDPSIAPATGTSIRPAAPPAATTMARPFTWEWRQCLLGCWLAGVAMGSGWLLRQHVRLRLSVRRSRAATNAALPVLLEECKALIGVTRRVGVFESPAIMSPALIGVWRPRILLPCGMIGQTSRSDLRHVLLHELAHLRRQDLAINWLAAWLRILHWFNPLVSLACARLRWQQELACDEAVLAALSPQEWRQYGHTLVNLSGTFTSHAALGRVGILESHKLLEQRIIMIRNYHSHSTSASCAALGMLLGLATVSLVHSAAADEPSQQAIPATDQHAPPGKISERLKTPEIHLAPGKLCNYYHLRFQLTPDNCELSIPNEQRLPKYSKSNIYKFDQGGQFEVFIHASAFPVHAETPMNKPEYMILRMPWTNPDEPDARQKIAEKRILFDRIQTMKTEGKGNVEVIIQLDHAEVLTKQPLTVKMTGINVFFRQADGRYINDVGPLKQPDQAE